jgi:DNA segregation ATPase FtsK/SpoIIIE-like protein
MDERGEAFSQVGAHDFQDFNHRTRLNHSEARPRLLIMVDDITCLLGSSAKEIESRMSEVLLRGDDLGVHLVVTATPPLPSAIDHWTKDDFTCRVAFWVRDHREINRLIEARVADTLLPYGDMLVATTPDSDNVLGLVHLHAPWVSKDARLRMVQCTIAAGSKPV